MTSLPQVCTRAALLVVAALAGAPLQAQEPAAADVAFIEWRCQRDEVWLRETLDVRLRFGFESQFLAERMVQPFRRQLDIPAQVQLADWSPPDCLSALPAAPPERGSLEFVLGEQTARAVAVGEELRDQDTFRVFEYAFRLVVDCQGALQLPAPVLSFATAASFSEDVFGNRTSLERRDLVLRGAARTLQALPLPSQGRPVNFSGAVGELRVSAAVHPAQVHLGEGVQFDLVVEGSGALTGFEPPRLALEGFGVRGWVEASSPRRRTITYDLAPLDARVRGVPPVEFSYFDPTPPAGYRTVATGPLELEVLPARLEAAVAPEPDVREVAPPRAPSRWWVLLLFAPLPLLLRRKRDTSVQPGRSALALRARDAADRFRSRADDTRLLEDYSVLLAAFLDCPVPAVVGARLERRLADVGLPRELAGRLALLHEELVSARYGGPSARDVAQVQALVEELAAALS